MTQMFQTISKNIGLSGIQWWNRTSFTIKDGLVTTLMIITSILLPFIIISGDGSVVYAISLLLIIATIFITIYRLHWGFYIFVALVFAADGYDIAGLRPWTYTIFYLMTFNVIFKGLGVGVLTPMECHLIFLLVLWLFVMVVKKDVRFKPVPLWGPALLSFTWLVGSVIYGRMRGGDPLMALWEVRALSYLAILFFFVPQIIQSKRQIIAIFWIFIWTFSFKAYQAVDRFVRLGFDFGGKRTLANHEDPLFFVTLFVFLIGLYAYGGNPKQRKALMYLFLLLLLGFYVANRRATYVAFAIGVITIIILLTKEQRHRIAKYLVAFSVVFVIYLAVYWNSYGRIAMIASAVKSSYQSAIGDTKNMNYNDYTSGLARDQENYNLAVTFRRAPLLGIGFGNQHEWIIRNYGEYALKGYITHNEILWLITKSGAVGFLLFFFMINCIVMRGAWIFTKLKDPYLKVVCAVCIIAVFGQIVVSYVDMQLTFFRNMVHLGLLVGMIPAIEAIDKNLSSGTEIS